MAFFFFLTALSSWSKRSLSMPSTTLPNIWMKRRYESLAKRPLFVLLFRPSTERSLRPRFKMVSIIPGIENFAPLRTETRSGSAASPSFLPMSDSSLPRFFSISFSISGVREPPRSW